MAKLINMEWLLAQFKRRMLTPTGKQEFMPLYGIDTALADALNDAFSPLVVSEPDRYTQSFNDFLNRSPRDRITIGTFATIQEWLTSFTASKAGRKDSKLPSGQVNKLAMPLINLSRLPAFSVYEGELSADSYNDGQITDENGNITALVSTMPVYVNYMLWIASDERESMNMVAMALSYWLRFYASKGQATFTAMSTVGDAEIPVNCVIEGQKSISFTDLAMTTDEDRLFAIQLDLNIVADIPLLTYVKQTTGKISLNAKVSPGNRAD